MTIYQIFGKSGFVYIARPNVDLETNWDPLSNDLVRLSDCYIMHPKIFSDSILDHENLLEDYRDMLKKENSWDILKKGPLISMNSIESILKLE